MEIIYEHLKEGVLHHAYLIEGQRAAAMDFVHSALDRAGIMSAGNPDVVIKEYSNFSIEASRELKEEHSQKSFGGGKRFFIISADGMLYDAQNSLLKIFEDPSGDSHFFIILPEIDSLLPTLRSRFFVVRGKSDMAEAEAEGERFLKMPAQARLDEIAEIIKKAEDAEDPGISKNYAFKILDGVEAAMFTHTRNKAKTEEQTFRFKEIYKARKYLFSSGASVKMLLEHLAVILPTK